MPSITNGPAKSGEFTVKWLEACLRSGKLNSQQVQNRLKQQLQLIEERPIHD